MKNTNFFIDDDGYVVIEDPQHGQPIRLGEATEEDILFAEWIQQGRDPEAFPKLGKITEEDLEWARKELGSK